MTFVLGLTGSIGMGKSTVARFLKEQGIPVHDSDTAVHDLYQCEAVALIAAEFAATLEFKDVIENNAINRGKLAQFILKNPQALPILEAIIHPLVRMRQNAFVQKCQENAKRLCVLEIPLLFETNAQKRCHAVLVVSSSLDIQRSRVLARPNMTPERFEMIHVKQFTDTKKRKNAHFIIETSGTLEQTKRQVSSLIRAVSTLC